jgi:6-phosphogluconate dehydrogenase
VELGIIGLGRMGSNMALRLLKDGHACAVYDTHAKPVEQLVNAGAAGTTSLDAFVTNLAKPRTVWLMVPAAAVDEALRTLVPLLDAGDTVIDGGNSYYRDDIRRAAELKARAIHYVDVGTSGGVAGLERGYCLMIGGEREVVERLDPIFRSLAPGVDAATRTPNAPPSASTADQGYLHCGGHGAGHFVKMVHNGIEYGLMAAYAEGLNILRNANTGKAERAADAETAPLREPEYYQYDFDLAQITELWRRGSVISSWLLDLTARALNEDGNLDAYAGEVSDSGEGRWTIAAAIDESVPAPVLSAALYERFSSRGHADFANRVLSAMRHQFGGHTELRTKPERR